MSGVSPVRFFLPRPSQSFFSKEGNGGGGGGVGCWESKAVGRLHLAWKGAGTTELAQFEIIPGDQVLPPGGQT